MTITSVLVDSREPEWVRALDFGVPSVVGELECGDVWAATDDGQLLVVERKTGPDLLASIGDGRLFDQAARMVQQSPWSYVVITEPVTSNAGNIPGSGWKYSAVMGALLTVQELGVAVVWADGPGDFGPCVQRLAKRSRAGVRGGRAPKRGLEGVSPSAGILAALPGIGPERALALLEHLPNAAWALQYLTDTAWPEHPIPGVSNGTRAKVRSALGLEDKVMLALIPIQEEKDHD